MANGGKLELRPFWPTRTERPVEGSTEAADAVASVVADEQAAAWSPA